MSISSEPTTNAPSSTQFPTTMDSTKVMLDKYHRRRSLRPRSFGKHNMWDDHQNVVDDKVYDATNVLAW